jgi:hypothetical protein
MKQILCLIVALNLFSCKEKETNVARFEGICSIKIPKEIKIIHDQATEFTIQFSGRSLKEMVKTIKAAEEPWMTSSTGFLLKRNMGSTMVYAEIDTLTGQMKFEEYSIQH